MRAAVLGAGSWGTALGRVLADKEWPVTMWDIDTRPLDSINADHENSVYLPGIPMPPSMRANADLAEAIKDAELIVLAVPSGAMRMTAEKIRDLVTPGTILCSVTKGIEVDTLMTMSHVLEDVMPVPHHPYLTFLSGPSFAIEVAQSQPTLVTIAAQWDRVAKATQEAFAAPYFRPYTSNDVMGVEVAGCVKNVIAIASGLADGIGFDANVRAALVTRGLAEITRLAVAMGGNPQTLAGLSGLGDLMLTCTSVKSRNYRVGYGLGQGKDLPTIQAELGQVAEGVINAKSVRGLTAKFGVEMPICEVTWRVLYDDLAPKDAVRELMERQLKSEV